MEPIPHRTWRFRKMHGLGNDFLVVDARQGTPKLDTMLIEALGDRRRGVGFDQLAVISEEDHGVHLTFYNADGSKAAACGNATRCIADWIMPADPSASVHLTTERGELEAKRTPEGLISVNMGHPLLDWASIPLKSEMETLNLPLAGGPTATGMGNPHCTYFVEDAEAVELTEIGPRTENDPIFPERTNVQIAQLIGPDRIRVRVWERGVGVTLASGSSACAVTVAAVRRELTGNAVEIVLDGGVLNIEWRDDGVWMTGPAAHVFDGVLTPAFLESVQG